jgi:hypothetical protein
LVSWADGFPAPERGANTRRDRAPAAPITSPNFTWRLNSAAVHRRRAAGGSRTGCNASALALFARPTNNPARRLYARFGFEVVETRTDSAYEALTGVAGRVLMIKTVTMEAGRT